MKDDNQKYYFSQTGLHNLKSDIDLVFAIGTEIKLLQKGKRFFGRCPLHDDNDKTLVISAKKNLWYCFGDCKKGGSILDWVMGYEKLKMVEAMAVLAERYPFLAQKGQAGKLSINEALPDSDLLKHQAILLQIVDHYQTCLPKHPRAIRYLRSLGISQSKARKHKIGYCDNTLVQTFIERVMASDELVSEEIHLLGLLQNTEPDEPVKERFYQQVVFPLFDDKGQVVQLFGRNIPEKIKISHVSLMVS